MSSTPSVNQCHIDEKVESESLVVNTNNSTAETREEVKEDECNSATISNRSDATKICETEELQNNVQAVVNDSDKSVRKSTNESSDNFNLVKSYDSSILPNNRDKNKIDIHINVEIIDENFNTDPSEPINVDAPQDDGELNELTVRLMKYKADNVRHDSKQDIKNISDTGNISNDDSFNYSLISTDTNATWSCLEIDKDFTRNTAVVAPVVREENFFDGLSMTETQISMDLETSQETSLDSVKSSINQKKIEKRRSSLNDNTTAEEFSANGVSDERADAERPAEAKSSMASRGDLKTPKSAEKILEEYSGHKSKLSARTHDLPDVRRVDSEASAPSQSDALAETRFARPQKAILSQDLGSMFKNVHGIFSSVSGSLKNAYIVSSSSRPNVTQSVAKALQNGSLRNASTGKIMNDIFAMGSEVDERPRNEVTEEKAETSTARPIATAQLALNAETVTRITMYPESHALADPRVSGATSCDFPDLQEPGTLEQILAEQRREVAALREENMMRAAEAAEKDRLNKELEHKLDLLRGHASSASRTADAAVVRYATAERGGIEARAEAERARHAQRAASIELELVSGRLSSAHAEKKRICKMFDDKCHELMQMEQQASRLREELTAAHGSLKWNQAKLRTEMEAYKESAALAERLAQQLSQLEEQRDAAQASAADSVRARELEKQLTETQAALILERHECDKATSAARQRSADLEQVRTELATANAELHELRAKVHKLTTHNQALEEEAAELATLRARAALCDTLTVQLESERARAMAAEDEASRQRSRAESGARREAAALEHAARVTADHVAARSACEHHEAKSAALSADNSALIQRVSVSDQRYHQLQCEADLYKAAAESAREECLRSAGQLEGRVEELEQRLEWERGENAVLRRKHSSALKELNRELQRTMKRCDQLEARQADANDRLSNRTGSISSLNSNSEQQLEETRVNGHAESSSAPRLRENSSPEILLPERQVLIERIVELQRAGARRAERCDFLEEHARQLTAELKKKTRLLRHLALQLPAGALTSLERDLHKSEVARLGGGSLDGMSLETALEINRKLQAVLEDALLKNITLKDNMDTLGAEIARLHGNDPNTSKGGK